jgi:arylsulfatase A-like enzyme
MKSSHSAILLSVTIVWLGCAEETTRGLDDSALDLHTISLTDKLAGQTSGTEVVEDGLRMSPGSTLSVPVFLPRASELTFSFSPASAFGQVHISVQDDNVEDHFVPELLAGADAAESTMDGALELSECGARLRGKSGPVVIRIKNVGHQTVTIRNPRLVSSLPPLPPATLPDVYRSDGKPFNVLFYVIDTGRLDRFSLYGYPGKTTPRLEALAQHSAVFQNAYAPGPSTTPSITALFASRHPSELGGRILDPALVPQTLAEIFQQAGHATAAFQANYMLREDFGYARGFDLYQRFMEKVDGKRKSIRAEALSTSALEWLREQGNRPFFLYIQSMDVHDYRPPEPFASQFKGTGFRGHHIETADLSALAPEFIAQLKKSLDRYDATIAYADHQIGLLLDELEKLGVADRTLIVITADHGEPLLQRGHLAHGTTLHEELVHVPLLIHAPWARTALEIDDVVSLIDLAPTLADIARVEISTAFKGRSLIRPLPASEPARALGTRTGGKWKNQNNLPKAWYLREGDWKLILSLEESKLYHLPSDPHEEQNVAAQFPATEAYLRSEIIRNSPAFSAEWREPKLLEEDLAPEARVEFEDALRSLGYIE